MKISVTQKHIEEGEAGLFSCPIALATLDSLSIPFRQDKVEVTSFGFVYVYDNLDSPTRYQKYELPDIAIDFVDSFDRYIYSEATGNSFKCPKPIEFEMEISR